MYIYNKDLLIEEIKQEKGKQTTVTWCRKEEEEILLRNVVSYLNQIENKHDVESIINTFPADLKKLIGSFFLDKVWQFRITNTPDFIMGICYGFVY